MMGKPEGPVHGGSLTNDSVTDRQKIDDPETVEKRPYECCICDSHRFLSISESFSRSSRTSVEIWECVECGSRVEEYGGDA